MMLHIKHTVNRVFSPHWRRAQLLVHLRIYFAKRCTVGKIL